MFLPKMIFFFSPIGTLTCPPSLVLCPSALRTVPMESVIASLPRLPRQLDTAMTPPPSVHSVVAQFYKQITAVNGSMVL